MSRCLRWLTAIALALAAAADACASIEITGLRQVTGAEARALIADQIAQIEEAGASRPLADDASFFLERGLRRRGFDKADVRWQFDEPAGRITLVVDEGAGQTLGDITISGNVAEIAEEDLRALVRRATANRAGKTILDLDRSAALPFVESDLVGGLQDVAQLYRSLGYWDARVAPLDKSLRTTGGRTDVHLQIEAGRMHTFRAIELSGDRGPDSAALEASLDQLVGQPFTTENVASARNQASDHYGRLGYYQHEITASPVDHGSEITLDFAVVAGQPFEVAGLSVEGNQRVKTDFLLKRFDPLTGMPYSPAAADKIYRELLGTGLFNRISLSPVEIPGADNQVDLAIEVDEAKARSAGIYGGYGSYDGAILGLIFRENNVFGTGRQFKGTAEYNQRGLLGEVSYSDPWFYNTPFSWEARLFGLTEQHDGYEKFETGFRAELGREIGDHYSVTTFATLGYTDITDAEIEAADLGLPNYRVGSVGLTHRYDTRNHPTLPSRGSVFDNTIEYAAGPVGSEVDFVRGTVRFSTYIPITKRSQLSLGARSGFIKPTGDSDEIPIDLRFFSGGGTTVRSFRNRHLGPTDRRGFPLGGEFYTTFNAEYSVPIVGGLKAAVFADAGNLLTDLGDAGLDDMHYALGTGLRYDLPTGPIRLDYGWNMNRGPREPSGTFHISIGFAF